MELKSPGQPVQKGLLGDRKQSALPCEAGPGVRGACAHPRALARVRQKTAVVSLGGAGTPG